MGQLTPSRRHARIIRRRPRRHRGRFLGDRLLDLPARHPTLQYRPVSASHHALNARLLGDSPHAAGSQPIPKLVSSTSVLPPTGTTGVPTLPATRPSSPHQGHGERSADARGAEVIPIWSAGIRPMTITLPSQAVSRRRRNHQEPQKPSEVDSMVTLPFLVWQVPWRLFLAVMFAGELMMAWGVRVWRVTKRSGPRRQG